MSTLIHVSESPVTSAPDDALPAPSTPAAPRVAADTPAQDVAEPAPSAPPGESAPARVIADADESNARPAPDIIHARNFGMASHDPAFAGLDITLPAGQFAAVVGPAGAGKSTLLLALTARMRPVTGELRIGGVDARKHPGQVRGMTSVARILGLIEPEPSLTLEDCLTERTLFDGARARSRMALYLHAARLLGLKAPVTTFFGDLPPLDQTRAALALACVRPATIVALDDLDDDATLEDQRALWAGIAALTADGQPVIASTTERTVIPDDALIIDLKPEA